MRIVAGSHGGRRLVAPRDEATRPTADRVREALFSILGPLSGERVLDLYAGTGALALEAISRGAGSAVLVESRKPALDAIAENVASLGLRDRVQVIARPVERARASLGEQHFGLIFCDPPYAAVENGQAIKAIASLLELLTPGGRLVLEHASQSQSPQLPGLEAPDVRRYGDTTVSIYEKAGAEGDEARG